MPHQPWPLFPYDSIPGDVTQGQAAMQYRTSHHRATALMGTGTGSIQHPSITMPAPTPRGAATPLVPRDGASPCTLSFPSPTSVPRPSFSFPSRPHPSAVLAITTGRAVTLEQTSPLSPATNQGQAAVLLDRACSYVLLLLMSSPARCMGTRRRRDSISVVLPIQGLLPSDPVPSALRVNDGDVFSP